MRIVFLAAVFLSLPAGATSRVEAPPALPAPETVAPGKPEPERVTPPTRGQMLYANHCTRGHESLVHIRDRRRAKSPAELRAQVIRWSDDAELRWKAEDIDEVTRHLDARYYRFGQ